MERRHRTVAFSQIASSEKRKFTCEPRRLFITIRSSFHTPRAKASPMKLRTSDMQTPRSTTVDGVLRMRSGILDGHFGLRLTAGALR